MPERVFFINSILGVGSTGRLIAGLIAALKERGIESMAAYGRFDAPLSLPGYRVTSKAGVAFHGALSRITDRHGLYNRSETKKLLEKIEEFDPTLIHVHNVHGYYLHYKVLFDYLKTCGRRLVWTLHDCWAFTGHCTHYQYTGCDKWKDKCGGCPQKAEYPKSMLMDSSAYNLALKRELFTGIPGLKLVTPSKWLAGEVKSSFLGEYEVETVPTGIDLSVFKPLEAEDLRKKYGLMGKKVVLGVANPWRERKGLGDFIKLRSLLDEGTAIVMLGLKESQKKGIPDGILALGKTDSAREMAKWYSLADVFCNLTYEDTFPTTNIEALACGTPVVTYMAGGSMESLTEDTGIGIKVGHVDEIPSALKHIFEGTGRYTSEQCIKRGGEYSAPKRTGEYIEKVYGL